MNLSGINMKFGNKEIKAFAENHEDERVRIIYHRLCEARSKNASWCNKVAELEREIEKLKVEKIRVDAITTGHTNCEKCNGTGAIPYQTFEPGTMKFDSAWIKCDWCSESVKTCKYCDGAGQIPVTVSLDPKTRESKFGYSTCRNCNGKGYL